jgi:hypothetical protein
MYSLWKYFYPEQGPTMTDHLPIKFGRWNCQLDYLDYCYNDLATRLIQFAKEAGKDPYGRYFDAEPLVDFVVSAGISDKSADYMYRHYVYHLLSKHEHIDIEQEELRYLIDEFTLLPEGIKVYYDRRELDQKNDHVIDTDKNVSNDSG